MRTRPGFTLIELLLVIGIVAILACIVIVALNPTQQIGKAHDVQRRLDLNDLADAIDRYRIDNKGKVPAGIGTASKPVCQADVSEKVCDENLRGVSLNLLIPDYTKKIPRDPLIGETGTGTRYMIKKNADGTVTLLAPATEREEVISVTK